MSESLHHAIHYVASQAAALHMPALDVELIRQLLLTRLMAPPSAFAGFETCTFKSQADMPNEDLAQIAARRIAAGRLAHGSSSSATQIEEECADAVRVVTEKLSTHRKATLRAIAATRAYDAAWAALVPALRRFEVQLPLHDIHSAEGRLTIAEHIGRCVSAMRALAIWQANAINLVEAIVLWRSGLNRPFPFALDGHCNILLRLALDAAAIRSSPVPATLLVGGAGVSLDQVVFPTFLSHLPSLCEFALSTSTPAEAQHLFSFSFSSASLQQQPAHSAAAAAAGDHMSIASLSTEDDLVRSLTRRFERRALAMHFASGQDMISWAIEAAEDVVAGFALLPGRRGPQQEHYFKRARAAEVTVSCEHNTHWQLLRELMQLCSEGKHVPLLHIPELFHPKGGEEGVAVDCPQLLEQLLRTLVVATESLNAITNLQPEEQPPSQQQQPQYALADNDRDHHQLAIEQQQQQYGEIPSQRGSVPPVQ